MTGQISCDLMCDVLETTLRIRVPNTTRSTVNRQDLARQEAFSALIDFTRRKQIFFSKEICPMERGSLPKKSHLKFIQILPQKLAQNCQRDEKFVLLVYFVLVSSGSKLAKPLYILHCNDCHLTVRVHVRALELSQRS